MLGPSSQNKTPLLQNQNDIFKLTSVEEKKEEDKTLAELNEFLKERK